MSTDTSQFEQIVPEESEVTEAVVEAYAELPLSFREQWDAVRDLAPEELVERVQSDFADSPEERRDVLTAHLAQRLGYLWYLNRADDLLMRPLWDLQKQEVFETLDASDRRIVWMIAGSTKVSRPTLHPAAALAALALWRFGSKSEHDQAAQLLEVRGLPDEDHFLHDLVREIGRRKFDDVAAPGRDFESFARLLLDAGYYATAARIGAFQLVRRYDAWWFGAAEPNLRKGVTKAAETDPLSARRWLDLIADAAAAGTLRWDWLEPALKAAIRLELYDVPRRRRLEDYHRRRLYLTGIPELAHHFRYELRDLEIAPPPRLESRAGRTLWREVLLAETHNPVRAMRLLELILGTASDELIGTAGTRLHHVLHQVERLSPPFERLAALFVRCLVLEPQAMAFVRRFESEIDWAAYGVSPEDVRDFYLCADYESPYVGRMAEFEGMRVAHVERDSATRVRYFVMRRANPNTITRLVQDVELPDRWIATQLSKSAVADAAFGFAIDGFINRVILRDGRREALRRYRASGVELDRWEDIRDLPITTVEKVARRLRHRGLVWGAVAGGTAGAFAPASAGFSSFADMPVLLHQVADLVADYCWVYGVDPRTNPEISQQILAVALRGMRGATAAPEESRKVLQRLTFRKSLLVAAIGQRAIAQLLAPAIQTAIGAISSGSTRGFVGQAAAAIRPKEDTRSRVVNVAHHAFLPLAAGLTGAVLDVSLIYDVCESARAVLSDQFFDRKYEDWTPFFSSLRT